jgi:hypothetical protein
VAKILSKVSFFVFSFVCLSLLTTFGTSYADVACTVKVDAVYMTTPGSTNTGVIAVLRNTTGATIAGTTWANNTARNFYVSTQLGNQGLAILLTALSNKTKVAVGISGTAVANSLLTAVAVTQTAQ